MWTALDLSTEALDQYEQPFVAKVREHGWFRTSVPSDSDGPVFSFTTGFWVNIGRPELIMFGMKADIAHQVFWNLFRDVKAGRPLPAGTPIDRVFANSSVYVFPVAKRFYADHLGWSMWFYGGDDFPCLQIVWSDGAGVFPWEEGFDRAFTGGQTDLTENGWRAALAE